MEENPSPIDLFNDHDGKLLFVGENSPKNSSWLSFYRQTY